jgi:hypothetical protein
MDCESTLQIDPWRLLTYFTLVPTPSVSLSKGFEAKRNNGSCMSFLSHGGLGFL